MELPYGGSSWYLCSTYGQLVRLSEAIWIGSITGVSATIPEQLNYTVTVEKVLSGALAAREVILQGDRRKMPVFIPSQRVLVFVPSPEIDSDRFLVAAEWGWRAKAQPAAELPREIHVRYAKRAIVPLAPDETNLVPVVEQYLSYLKNPTPDKELPYFWFLHGLLQASDVRQQYDARADMMFLCHSLEDADLATICGFSHIDPGVRHYAEDVMRWRKEGPAAHVRDLTPTEDQIWTWLEDLKSGDRSRIDDAILEFYSRTNWLQQSTAVWQAAIVDLLAYTNQTIRLCAADMLSEAGDRRSVPVLVEGLMSDTEGLRKECWKKLQRFYGTPVAYDPAAPAAERQAMVAAWEAWHQRQPQEGAPP